MKLFPPPIKQEKIEYHYFSGETKVALRSEMDLMFFNNSTWPHGNGITGDFFDGYQFTLRDKRSERGTAIKGRIESLEDNTSHVIVTMKEKQKPSYTSHLIIFLFFVPWLVMEGVKQRWINVLCTLVLAAIAQSVHARYKAKSYEVSKEDANFVDLFASVMKLERVKSA